MYIPLKLTKVARCILFVCSTPFLSFRSWALAPYLTRAAFTVPVPHESWPTRSFQGWLRFYLIDRLARPRLPALVSGLVEDETPPLLLYTDAAFSRGRRLGRRWCEQACGADARAPNTYTARMAFVVADPVDGWKAFSDAPPAWEDVSFLAPDKETYISQMEAMAVVAAFYSLASSHLERLRGRRVNAFIDNTAALSALVHGYTGKEDLAKISNAYHLQLASLRAAAYLEFVPSEANIADLPSRRKYELMRLLGIQPLEFHMPRMSDWSSPLVEWLRRFNSTGPSWQV